MFISVKDARLAAFLAIAVYPANWHSEHQTVSLIQCCPCLLMRYLLSAARISLHFKGAHRWWKK